MSPSLMRLTRVVALVVLVSIGACTSDVEPLPPARRTLVAAVPRLAVVQTTRSPRLDDLLEDPAWAVAKPSGPFVETRKGGIADIQASAKLLWDAEHLFVGVDMNDALLRASDRKHDAHLWKQDCVELMLDPVACVQSRWRARTTARDRGRMARQSLRHGPWRNAAAGRRMVRFGDWRFPCAIAIRYPGVRGAS